MDTPVFVGYRALAVSNFGELVEPPKMPATITKKETADAWRQDKYPALLAKAEDEAAYRGITGRIAEVWSNCNGTGSHLRYHDCNIAPAWFDENYESGVYAEDCVLIGFDVREFSRIIALEGLLAGMDVPASFWCLPSWQSDPMRDKRIDPYHVIVPKEERAYLSVQSLLKASKIDFPEGWEPHQDVKLDAYLAAQLAFKFRLVDSALVGDWAKAKHYLTAV
jgi:hypothetical protein